MWIFLKRFDKIQRDLSWFKLVKEGGTQREYDVGTTFKRQRIPFPFVLTRHYFSRMTSWETKGSGHASFTTTNKKTKTPWFQTFYFLFILQ